MASAHCGSAIAVPMSSQVAVMRRFEGHHTFASPEVAILKKVQLFFLHGSFLPEGPLVCSKAGRATTHFACTKLRQCLAEARRGRGQHLALVGK